MVIDLGAPASWPPAVRRVIDGLVSSVRDLPEAQPGRVSYDLRSIGVARDEAAEASVRTALSEYRIAAYHATRLLAHETDAIRGAGLLPLSDELRRARLERAAATYPNLVSPEEVASILASGPLDWQHGTAEGRLGVVSVVAPICAFAWEAHGLEPLLRQWGGESNYRQSGGSPATIERLTAISVPSIVEVALPSEVMAGPGRLWPVMVGTVLNLEEPFHEWQVRYSVPPASILAIIQPGDSHWPTGLDLIRS